MRRFYLSLLLLLTVGGFAAYGQSGGQTIKGKIVSESGEPIEFVNVILCSKADTTLIASVVTDSEGLFSFRVDDQSEKLILCSCVGFSEESVGVAGGETCDLGSVVLRLGETELMELTVVGEQKMFETKGTALVANVAGTHLRDAGDAFDVMKYIPLLDVAGESVSVFGKGAPIIYINKRRLRANVELSELSSLRIKSIEVDTAPGPEHPATVGAVIRINTLKSDGEGVSLITSASVNYQTDWSESLNNYLSYQNRGLTLYANLGVTNSRAKQDQETVTAIESAEGVTEESSLTKFYMHSPSYSASLGFDYNIDTKHVVGAMFRYQNSWDNNVGGDSENIFTDWRGDSESTERYMNFMDVKGKNRGGFLNTYYNGESGRWGFNWDLDYSFGTSSGRSNYLTDYGDGGGEERVKSTNAGDYDLVATRASVDYKVRGSLFNFGAQYTYTNSETDYINLSQHEDLLTSFTRNKQSLLGLFGSYSLQYQNFGMKLGVRYERLSFDYYLNNELQRGQSKSYNHLFPTMAFSYRIPQSDLSMSLSYNRITHRPTYYALRADIQYNTPHSYEGGNPALKSSFSNDIDYRISYKNLYFSATFSDIKDGEFFIIRQFEDKPISLATFINADRFQRLSLLLQWQKKLLKIWEMQPYVRYTQQFLDYSYEGLKQKHRKPGFVFGLQNLFELPRDFTIRLDAMYETRSDAGFNAGTASYSIDMNVSKEFKKAGVRLTLGVDDIFNGNKEEWSMRHRNVNFNKESFSNNRYIYFTLRFSLNRLKWYNRSGADPVERGRL